MPTGPRVILRNNANLSTGGTATDVTDDVHPEVASAVSAAHGRAWTSAASTSSARPCCVPARRAAAASSRSTPRPGLRTPVAQFGKGCGRWARPSPTTSTRPGDDGRIPVVAVTGTNGKTTVTRLIAHLFAAQG